jgi:hypothetical protein
VDDDRDIVNLLKFNFEKEGFRVSTALDVVEPLAGKCID